MNGYIKLPRLKPMADSKTETRLLSDNEWKEYVFFFILKYCNEVDQKEISALIETEKIKSRDNIESTIEKHIRNWLKWKCAEFELHELILNLEPSTEYNKEGFYDLKFEHSQWRRKYFSFEAKNLGKSKSITLSKSIEEYVYVKEKDSEDGGMYRYMNGKYACDMNFGGMLGFVIEKTKSPIVEQLIAKIHSVYDNKTVGKLINEKIVKSSIFGNSNTFDSFHVRQNYKTNQDEIFRLHHIIIYFVDN